MIVFVVHPYRGSENSRAANYRRLDIICHYMAVSGFTVFSPIHAASFLNDWNEEERNLGMEFAGELMKASDEVWVMHDVDEVERTSAGSRREIELARELRKPVRSGGGDAYWKRVGEYAKELAFDGEIKVVPDYLPGILQRMADAAAPPVTFDPVQDSHAGPSPYWVVTASRGRDSYVY